MRHRVGDDSIELAAVLHQEIRRERQPARGRADHVAEISEGVVIGVGRDRRIDLQPVPADEIGLARRMHADLQDHRRRLRAVVGDLVARTDFHE